MSKFDYFKWMTKEYSPFREIAFSFGIYRPKFIYKLKDELSPDEVEKILILIRRARKNRRLVDYGKL